MNVLAHLRVGSFLPNGDIVIVSPLGDGRRVAMRGGSVWIKSHYLAAAKRLGWTEVEYGLRTTETNLVAVTRLDRDPPHLRQGRICSDNERGPELG